MRLPTFYLIFHQKKKKQNVRDSNISGGQSTEEPNLAQDGRKVLFARRKPSQQTVPTGQWKRAEPRPITGDEFCVLGNLLKTQNFQSAAHTSTIVMTRGF